MVLSALFLIRSGVSGSHSWPARAWAARLRRRPARSLTPSGCPGSASTDRRLIPRPPGPLRDTRARGLPVEYGVLLVHVPRLAQPERTHEQPFCRNPIHEDYIPQAKRTNGVGRGRHQKLPGAPGSSDCLPAPRDQRTRGIGAGTSPRRRRRPIVVCRFRQGNGTENAVGLSNVSASSFMAGPQ